jgi:hypothetical protein
MIRRVVPLLVLVAMVSSSQARAQGSFPAPLPGQAQTGDAANPSEKAAPSVPFAGPANPFSSAGAPAFGTSDSCMKDFIPLREEAERRGKLIKAASDRHTPPDEACKLIGDFREAEARMIKYVEAHATACSISAQAAGQLKAGHENTARLLRKVCALAQQGVPAGPTGDFDQPYDSDIPTIMERGPAGPRGKE